MNFEALYIKLGYFFRNPEFLERALRHRSLGKQSNERLEFLGDSILNFIIADELFHRYPTMKEGDLSRLRANLVNWEILADLADELQIWDDIKFGPGNLANHPQKNRNILADAMEAIIGAIYLDSGFTVAQRHVLGWLVPKIERLAGIVQKDPKTRLQEYLQMKKLPLPHYDIMEIVGEGHMAIFKIACHVDGIDFITYGSAPNRRSAEREAAEQLLNYLVQGSESNV